MMKVRVVRSETAMTDVRREVSNFLSLLVIVIHVFFFFFVMTRLKCSGKVVLPIQPLTQLRFGSVSAHSI